MHEKTIYKKLGQAVKAARESKGINQQRLAEMLSMSRSSVSQIENGERKVAAGELLELSHLLSADIAVLLGTKKEPEVRLEKAPRPPKESPRIRINVPQKNIKKFKEVLLYILGKVGSKPNIGETVIYKLLYFVDFDYYEKYEEQIIGAKYIKNHYGPTPMEFKKIVEDMEAKNEVKKVKINYFNYDQTKYLPLREPDLSILNANEVKMVDEVLDRLSNMNASELSEYSHGDVPWLSAEDGEAMEYEAVFYRTSPYSLREYKD